MIRSILMVCYGNLCRSPMAEGLFSHYLIENPNSLINVSSAGLTAVVNQPPAAFAQQVMHEHGIDISGYRARQLTEQHVRQNNLILVMTQEQLISVERQFIVAKGKTFLLGHYQDFEIEDPYHMPYAVFAELYEQIELAWQDWKTRIIKCPTAFA